MSDGTTHLVRVRWTISAGLFVLTLLLFSRGVGHDFVNYDDPDYVTSNTHVLAGVNPSGVAWAFRSGEASNWHPLTWLSHMLDVSLFGRDARGHHATSLVVHALNAVLAFAAFRRLTGAVATSAVCAALFAWHPLRVESVAWVSERKDVLSGAFWLLTLWAYAGYAHCQRRRLAGEAGAGGAGRWYVFVLAAFALGLLAKPMLVTLPCVLLLLDFWPLRRLSRATAVRLVVEKIPLFLLAAVSSYVTYRVQQGGGAVTSALSVGARVENAAVAVVRYLAKFVWPDQLAVLYPHPGDWPAAPVAGAVVLIAAISGLAWLQRRVRPWLLVGWLWFLGTLVPVLGLVQVGLQSMADRYTYLPILGVEIASLWTLRELVASRGAIRSSLLAGGAAMAVAFALRTWDQIGVWQNSFTLFDHAVRVTERNYLAHTNRGLYLCDTGRVEAGMADYRRALAIHPGYPEANNNLGRMLVQQGHAAEAVPLLRRALEAKPHSLEVRNNLANALSDAGSLDEAITHYETILRLDARHVNALNGLGVALAMKGRPAEARATIEESLRLAPDHAGAHSNLGNVFLMLGQLNDAARHYRRAAQLQPDAHTHAQLGFTLAQLGRREEAATELREALRLRPDHAQAKAWLETVQAQPAR